MRPILADAGSSFSRRPRQLFGLSLSLPSGKAGATTLKLFAVSLRTRAGDSLARPPWSHFTTANKIQEPGLLIPRPIPRTTPVVAIRPPPVVVAVPILGGVVRRVV